MRTAPETETLSYTSQLKRDILANKQYRGSYKKQLACGLLCYSQHFSPDCISLTTMEGQAARFFAALVPRIIPLRGTITTTLTETAGNTTHQVSVDAWEDRLALLNYFAMLYPEGVTFDLLGGESGTAAFVAGAFLACGGFSDPNRSYHLEYAVTDSEKAATLAGMLGEVGFLPLLGERRGLPLVYFRDSQQIEDVLAFLGCSRLALEVMGIKILKERRNAANRASNCDNANIDKTVSAAAAQVAAIQKVLAARGEDALPDELREVALLRIAEPELSLRELGQQLSPPLSRSGVNHRLARLVAMAEELK